MRNRQELLSAAAEMTNIARTDVSNKLRELMRETDATEREMAYVLDIPDTEMYELLHNNGDVSLSTFMKIMIATGHALEIKPLGAAMPPADPFRSPTPSGPLPPPPPPPLHINEEEFREPNEDDDEDGYDDEVNESSDENEEMPEPPFFHPFPYGRPRVPYGGTEGCRPDDGLRPLRPTPRPFNPYKRPTPPRSERPAERPAASGKCDFRSKTRDELVRIIVNKLWDSEIDIVRSSFNELVSFLEGKERRRQQLQSGVNEESRPSSKVLEFIDKLKEATKENPNLLKYIKKYLKED